MIRDEMAEAMANQPIQWYPSTYNPTQREMFAAMAMQGICATARTQSDSPYTVNGGWLHADTIAKASMEIADALIAELNKEKP